MDKYNVLLVDDEWASKGRVFDELRNSTASRPDTHIETATTKDEAYSLIRTNFFHAAFVDIGLSKQSGSMDGLDVLRHLKENRPCCRRFLLTQFPANYSQLIFNLLVPGDPIIHGAIDKGHASSASSVSQTIQRNAEAWSRLAVKVENLQSLYEVMVRRTFGDLPFERASQKGFPARKVIMTVDEVDYLVSRVMGQGSDSVATAYDIQRVTWELLTDGRSSSIVLRAQPKTRKASDGINCVIKLGPVTDTQQEHLRYKRHVRFLVQLNRRVELLGHVEGDTLGVVCYSFAGNSPKTVRSLSRLLDEQKPVTGHLDTLFNPKVKEWYKDIESDKNGQTEFFDGDPYRLNLRAVLTHMDHFAQQFAPSLGGTITTREPKEILFEGDKLVLPRVGDDILRKPHKTCIIHGDLNAQNVMIGSGKVMLIDFSFTGRGPAALDFAALEASLRTSSSVVDRGMAEIVKDHTLERRVWSSFWKRSPLPDNMPYWARVSYDIMGLMRSNFPDLEPTEYATTCLLWALRLYKSGNYSLPPNKRLRLLVWMSALQLFLDGRW